MKLFSTCEFGFGITGIFGDGVLSVSYPKQSIAVEQIASCTAMELAMLGISLCDQIGNTVIRRRTELTDLAESTWKQRARHTCRGFESTQRNKVEWK